MLNIPLFRSAFSLAVRLVIRESLTRLPIVPRMPLKRFSWLKYQNYAIFSSLWEAKRDRITKDRIIFGKNIVHPVCVFYDKYRFGIEKTGGARKSGWLRVKIIRISEYNCDVRESKKNYTKGEIELQKIKRFPKKMSGYNLKNGNILIWGIENVQGAINFARNLANLKNKQKMTREARSYSTSWMIFGKKIRTQNVFVCS